MKIKMVADTTDEKTNRYLRKFWSNLSTDKKEKILSKIGHSKKWSDMVYDDLTGEIQSKLITSNFFVE